MINYQHLLLATDLSSANSNVAKSAVSFANKFNAKISVIHVVESLPLAYFDAYNVLEVEEDIRNKALDDVTTLANQMNINREDLYVETGVPKKLILECAKRLQNDVIIIGSHGRSGFSALLGSTANYIVSHASCDVFVVRLFN